MGEGPHRGHARIRSFAAYVFLASVLQSYFCVHAHGLRHTLASELAAERKPMNVIQAHLGHGSLATTSRYLDHIRPQQLIDEMQQREPWEPDGN